MRSKLAVHALKLTQLSIDQFLAPNLALLMDTLAGSDMQNLGPVIFKRLHDMNWEVRDSALEVLATTASISKISKYNILESRLFLLKPLDCLLKRHFRISCFSRAHIIEWTVPHRSGSR